MTIRRYSSISQETYLTTALNTTATTMIVNSAAVLGSITPASGERLTLVIDPDTALEEIVYAVYPSSPSSTTLTIIRGVDGTGVEGVSGVSHSAGAKIRHMAIGVDFREANNHIESLRANSATAHGIPLATIILNSDTGTVSTAMLASNAVTTAKITDANVTAAKLASDSVTTAKILDSNVTTAKIADSAVTSAKIADGTIVAGDIADGAITSAKILDGTIATADIADSAVTTAKIADSSITTAKIAAGAVITADLADSAVTSAKIADGTIVAGDLADGAVTSAKILDGTIVNADVNASAAIAYSKLALAGTITSADITNDTIVDGDINTAANIAWTKIAPSSTVSATELGYLDGVTSAIQTQIDTKLATATAASTYAPLASPALTGTPTAPTATAGTNTTQVATTAYVGTAISNLVAGAPTTLDTLDEIAAAIADTGNFSDTVVLKSGSTMSGALAMGTNKITGLGTPTAGTDATTKTYVDGVLIAPSNLTGPITSTGSATAIASQTGTGSTFVMNTSPTLVTPALGVATATSVNGTSIPSTKTLVVTTDKLSALAATTSSELAGVISDETGTGALVFANTPTLVTPALGDATATSIVATVASGTTVPLTIQNNGTGNSFVVNDEASDSTPFIIGTSGLVGIGKQPALALDVFADTGQARFSSSTGTNLSRVILENTGGQFQLGIDNSSGSAFSAGAYGRAIFSEGAYPLLFSTNSAERMRITAAGLVGIGISGPSGALLSIVNTTAGNIGTVIKGATSQTADLLQIQNSAGTVLFEVDSGGNVGIGTTALTTAGGYGSITLDGSSGTLWSAKVAGTETFRIQPTAASTVLNGIANLPMIFWTNSAERMRILATGELAIGTSSAGGFVHIRRDSGAGNNYITSSILQTTDQRLTLKTYWQSGVGQYAAVDSSTDSGGAQSLILQSGGTNRLVVTGAGNIGIGTDTPTAKLDVIGSIYSNNLSSVNPILNSSYNVWQRGTTISLGASSTPANSYLADRWQTTTSTGQASTISRVATGDTTNLPNIQYAMRYQRNSGQTGTGEMGFYQSLETVDSIPFVGKEVTLSFYARKGALFSGASNALYMTMYYGTGTDQSVFAYTNLTLVIDSAKTLTTTWQRFTATGTVPSVATEIAVGAEWFPTGTAGATDYFEVTGVQLELGSVATPYRSNQPTYQAELAACQRYYYRNFPGAGMTFGIGAGFGTNAVQNVMNFPVTMRIRPTALETTGTASDYSIVDGGGSPIVCNAAPSVGTATFNQAQFSLGFSGGISPGSANQSRFNSSSAFLGWSAEL
jgi:hypothetical protein